MAFSILHIICSVDPKGGGPIEGILQQAKLMSGHSHKVSVLTLDSPEEPFVQSFPAPIIALGTRLRRPHLPKRYMPWLRYGYCPKLVPWLKKNAKKYDIIVVNGLWNYATLGSSRALSRAKVPYTVFVHGMLDPWFKKTYPIKSLFKQIHWWISEGPLLRNANAVFFTTEEEMVLARNAFWPYSVKEKVTGFGTADVICDPDKQRDAFYAHLPQVKGKRYFLFLSRIHIKKGCDLLIEAFSKIAQSNPQVFLVIAGPDQTGWRKSLEALALKLGVGDRIFWPGMLTGDAKWGAFRDAEAFVLPSHQENFGIVVVEALALGKPVLITNKVNIWREVVSAGAGLVDDDSLAGITRLFQRFLSLPSFEIRAMEANARIAFLQHFEISAAAVTINKSLEEAIA